MTQIQSSERDDRLEKLHKLSDSGVNPFPQVSGRSHHIKEVFDQFEALGKSGREAVVAGRLRTIREHGNLSFAHIEDSSGRIQLAFSKKDIGDQLYKDFLRYIDIGDFLEAVGTPFVTHKGEKSLMVKSYKLAAKALRPLPDKWHGLSDDDKRQRFRELEMLSNVRSAERFKRRSSFIRALREFMWENSFTEIETPVLQNVYGGTYAKPFTTHYNALDFDLYLRIAPEIFLKRAVVGGFEKIFEIGKCFRNEGMGPAHLQEFTMFEFYWPYGNYFLLMDFTEKMIEAVVERVYGGSYDIAFGDKLINMKPPYPRVAFRDLIKQHLGVEFCDLDTAEKVDSYVKMNNLEGTVHLHDKLSWPGKIDELYKKTVRKKIIQPVFVTDYPKEFMALAKTKEDDPSTVATFQLVVNGWEIVKAYNELNDPIDQRERFEAQERLKLEGDEEAMPYDRDFVESMEYGMPPLAGWGMGLDRFFALMEGDENLRDVIIFPTMKPKAPLSLDTNNVVIKIDNYDPDTLLAKTGSETDAEIGLDKKQADELVEKYINDPATKSHLLESEAIMKALAKRFGEDEEKWGIIGLLHDIDWDLTKQDVKNHCGKAVEILEKAGGSDFLIRTIISHNYGWTGSDKYKNAKRATRIEHCLAAAETLTGLIAASAMIQPDKKLESVKLLSLQKKFKQKAFAANCDREIIKECESAGVPLNEFLELGLDAMKGISRELGL